MARFAPFPLHTFALSFLVLAISGTRAADLPAPPEKATPGSERGVWTLEAWGNAGAAERASLGDLKLLRLIYNGGDKDKAAFKHLTCLGLGHKSKLRMQVYCADDQPPQIGLALSTTPAYIWHESKPVDLKKGWNKIEIDASASTRDWKTATSEWKFSTSVEPREDVRAIDVVVYNGNRTGAIYVLGLQYDPDAAGEKVSALINELRSEEPEKREKAEKELVAIGRPAMEMLYQLADDDRPEVLLRAASALRQIENIKEAAPPDPKIRAELEKQREEQAFEEARRRADYTLKGLENERLKLLTLLKDAQTDSNEGRAGLAQMKFVEAEKRKAYEETLNKIEATIKELGPLMIPQGKK